jgi:hypothetical protein
MFKKQESKLKMCFMIQRTQIKNFILLFFAYFAFFLVYSDFFGFYETF